MPGIFILIISAIILIIIFRLLFSGKRKNRNSSYQSQDFAGKKMSKDEFQKKMANMTRAKVYGKKESLSSKNKRDNNYKNPFTDPWNPANPNSPLNPMNPANPNSPRNPMNPLNPASPLNLNNPANPNSRNNPANRNNPLGVNNPNSPNYFGKKR